MVQQFSRRALLQSSSLALMHLAMARTALGSQGPARDLSSRRPRAADRRFVSPPIEEAIANVAREIGNPELAWLFANCLPNSLDTTVFPGEVDGKPDTFVITGDINAMWLRDSSAQVQPYLPFAPKDPALRRLLEGVIRRHTRCILIDSYANAFQRDPSSAALPWAEHDETRLVPGVAERKWEVDSLCYPIRLAYGYWRCTGDGGPFDAQWSAAMQRVLTTFREQQRKQGAGPYSFRRETKVPTDTLMLSGFGNPAVPNGLIYSMFRPSDDACTLPQFIPANLFAAVTLRQLAELAHAVRHDAAMANDATALADEVTRAVAQHGQVMHPVHGGIWAYEVDGYGNHTLMDDANSPGLLGLPYFKIVAAQVPLYQRTRAFALSQDNPYFFRGRSAAGIGSPHTELGMIWPMSLVMQAMTSTSDAEIRQCLRWLCASSANTGFMHESFQSSNPAVYTRAWFAWSNTLFGELILHLHQHRPAVLRSA